MNDPNSPDRVPLDRPPVPRFNPLPDFPDLPEMPRGSSIPPTPSVPIPAPPMPLPAPRVMVDPPKPTVSVEPPRPAPRTMTPPPKPAEAPKPVTTSTPAPKGRWVGEALASLVQPTKSKATVLAAAGSLVAGAFGLQVLVSQVNRGDAVATTTDFSTPKPKPAVADDPSTSTFEPFVLRSVAEELPGEPLEGIVRQVPERPFLPALPVAVPLQSRDSSGQSTFVPPLPNLPASDPYVQRVGGQAPIIPVVPTLPLPEAPAPSGIPPASTGIPVVPGPAPVAVATSTPIPIPTPIPAAPDPIKLAPPPVPVEVSKAAPLPALPLIPIEPAPKTADVPNPFELPPVKPATPQQIKPAAPVVPGFKINPDPPAPAPAMRPIEPTPVPVQQFVPVETPRETVRPVPPAAGEVRTDYDVDLHPAQAGQTYESISKQHYGDAKYADALRASNKNRDPGRDEIQLPPTHVLRTLIGGSRAPAAGNPIAPAGGETWAPSPTAGPRPATVGRSYTVPQDGTSFRDLAGTLLNDRAKYKRISDLNPTIDANAKLNKGDKIAVP